MARFLARAGILVASLLATSTESVASEPRVVVAEGRQPQAAVDAKGGIHLVYGLGDEIRYVALDSEGKPTSNPVIVGKAPSKLALGMRRGPRIAVSGRGITVTAIDWNSPVDRGKFTAYEGGTLLAWRSTDGGRSWQGPVAVNTVRGSAAEGLHALAAGPEGAFFVAWNDNRSQSMEVYGARSNDGGANWVDETLVYRSPEKSICPCCHPSAAFAADGSLHVMWRNQLFGRRDLHLARSLDGGKSFEPAVKQGEGSWSFNACPMDGGAIAPSSRDSVTTAWMREARAFESTSGSAERSLGRGVQPWCALGPEGVSFAWITARPGKLMIRNPGDAKPTELAPSAVDPMLAAALGGRGPVVAVWEVDPSAGKPAGGHSHGTAVAGPIAAAVVVPATE
ncbi:MAG: sialidase family protein [Isosphaeraceae bacterium]|nr:sialidase family protein [Isosphaeraceae bacterium]